MAEQSGPKTYAVLDRQTQAIVAGPYGSRKRASRRADQLDAEYGGYRYLVVELGEDLRPRLIG